MHRSNRLLPDHRRRRAQRKRSSTTIQLYKMFLTSLNRRFTLRLLTTNIIGHLRVQARTNTTVPIRGHLVQKRHIRMHSLPRTRNTNVHVRRLPMFKQHRIMRLTLLQRLIHRHKQIRSASGSTIGQLLVIRQHLRDRRSPSPRPNRRSKGRVQVIQRPLSTNVKRSRIRINQRLIRPHKRITRLRVSIKVNFTHYLSRSQQTISTRGLNVKVTLTRRNHTITQPTTGVRRTHSTTIIQQRLRHRVAHQLHTLPFRSRVLFQVPNGRTPRTGRPFACQPVLSRGSTRRNITTNSRPIGHNLTLSSNRNRKLTFTNLKNSNIRITTLLIPTTTISTKIQKFRTSRMITYTRQLPFRRMQRRINIRISSSSRSRLIISRNNRTTTILINNRLIRMRTFKTIRLKYLSFIPQHNINYNNLIT